MSTSACDQDIIMLKIFPSYSWISVLFPWHVFHIVKYVSVRGVTVAVNNISVHMDTQLSSQKAMCLCKGKNSMVDWFYISKDIGEEKQSLSHIFCS
jgi:hypothetical protein